VRTGDFRIIYDIRDGELLVLVIKVDHQRDVYKRR
jgi:mRNA interferase RelE/StbE